MTRVGYLVYQVTNNTPKFPLAGYAGIKTGSGHMLGTCRMGNDPDTSVLNRWCQTHEVDNLWVVDVSFFPTSGGYNPTLTIFANAYRVAAYFIDQTKRLNLR